MSVDDPDQYDLSLFPVGPSYGPRDLELLVMCLELGAIELSTVASSEFSEEKLLEAAKQYADPRCPPDDGDLRIVLQHVKFLRRLPGKRYQIK